MDCMDCMYCMDCAFKLFIIFIIYEVIYLLEMVVDLDFVHFIMLNFKGFSYFNLATSQFR